MVAKKSEDWRVKRDRLEREWAERAEAKRVEKEARRQANREAHAAKAEAWQQQREEKRAAKNDPNNDAHWVMIAASCTHAAHDPDLSDEYLARRDIERGKTYTGQDALDRSHRQAAAIAKIPPYEEQMKKLRPIDVLPHEEWPPKEDGPVH